MSTTVDNRVVQLTFDNKQFKEGIQDSLNDIQRFEAQLDTTNIDKLFDLSKVGNSITHLASLFDPLAGAAERAFIRMADQAVDAGVRMVKALSVDNVTAGWTKFGQKTTSVGTLIAQGFDIDDVTEQLERLNWYTDETSYNFTDMVDNIGKFTASGKGLNESVTAMEGIANWSALSGQNAQTASRAMYQISQAMGAGAMRREDYKSIQNANMDTKEFRQHALDAAVALGTLQKNVDGTYRSTSDLAKKVNDFTADQFVEELTNGMWFTDEVMMKVFTDYSKAVDQIYDYSQENGVTASDAISDLGTQVDAFGLKAFKAAQEARTFSDVIDSVKDASSTAFMNMFELLIGNYEAATKLYTNMANTMYDVFVEPINALNEGLAAVLGGEGGKRTEFIESLANMGNSLISIWNLVTESIRNVWEFNGFLPYTVEQIQNIITRIAAFTKSLIITDDYIREKLEKSLTGIFSILHIGFSFLKRVGKYIVKFVKFISPIVDIVLTVTAAVGDFFRILDNSISKIGFFNTFIKEGWRVLEYARIALDNFRRMLNVTFENNPKAKAFYDVFKSIFDYFGTALNPLVSYVEERLAKLWAVISDFMVKVSNIVVNFKMPDFSTMDYTPLDYIRDRINDAKIRLDEAIESFRQTDLGRLFPPMPPNPPESYRIYRMAANTANGDNRSSYRNI